MSAMRRNRTIKGCHIRLDYRKILVLCAVVSTCMVVYTSLTFGSHYFDSRFNGYFKQPENTWNMWEQHKARTLETLFVPSIRSQSSQTKTVLQSGYRQFVNNSANTTDLQPTMKSFMSPFIVQDSQVRKEKLGTLGARTTTSTNKMRDKTFAVIMPCPMSPPGCFDYFNHSMRTCSYNRCRQISDVEHADVVVFYAWRMKTEEHIPKLRRPTNQRWVMWTPEAANRHDSFSMLDFPFLKGQFNWTMTYRLDSDIVQLYGRLQRRALPVKNYLQIYRQKKFPAAWFLSHCQTNSGREKYVKRMQKIVDVHIFGKCGTYNCSMGANNREADAQVCLPMLSKTYHFYLAFENSMCQDYVTEKFFKLFNDVDVIPVVRGGADYKRLFPPDTFIDASDFDSPEDLAEFLLDLSKDSSRYIALLKEKSRYQLAPSRNVFCDLCEKMMTDDREKWYPDIRTWFTKDQCFTPDGL